MLTHAIARLAIAYLFCTTMLIGAQSEHHPLGQEERHSSELDTGRISAQKAMVQQTQVPVIGVLTQVLRDYKRFTDKHHLHLASSYVKWVESAGAQALPVLLNQDDSYYEQVFKQTNGLLFPGGDNLLDPHKATPMMVASRKLYQLALEANDRGDYYPIWGTCLGLELLSVLSSNRNVLDSCNANDIALPMEFVERGKMFEPNRNANLKVLNDLDYPKFIMDTLEQMPVTFNYHHKCLTDAGLRRANLTGFYRPLAYSYDKDQLKFIAVLEARNYPFYAVQFHPEKPPFEFTQVKHNIHVPHSRESIEVSRYFADFFIRQAQQSSHRALDQQQLQSKLIYAYKPLYTAPLNDFYEQRYLFPFDKPDGSEPLEFGKATEQDDLQLVRGNLLKLRYDSLGNAAQSDNPHHTIEFVEHVPADDEVVDEDVEDQDVPAEIELSVFNDNRKPLEPPVGTGTLNRTT